MLLKHGLAGLAQPPAGGNFAGVTASSTGVVNVNELTNTNTNTFAIENASDTVAIISLNTRLAKAGLTVSVTGVGTATLVYEADSGTSQALLYQIACPSVSSIEVVCSTSDPSLAQITVGVFHARDCAFGTPQTNGTAADPQTVSLTVSAGSSVISTGAYNNGGGAPTAVGVTYDWAVDMNSNDYSFGGHVDSLSAGTASYGMDTPSAPGNGAVGAVEVSQA